MTLRYIKSGINEHVAAKAWAKVNSSDPFAYGRTLSELSHHCSSQGLPSEVQHDALRIERARNDGATICRSTAEGD